MLTYIHCPTTYNPWRVMAPFITRRQTVRCLAFDFQPVTLRLFRSAFTSLFNFPRNNYASKQFHFRKKYPSNRESIIHLVTIELRVHSPLFIWMTFRVISNGRCILSIWLSNSNSNSRFMTNFMLVYHQNVHNKPENLSKMTAEGNAFCLYETSRKLS